MFAFKTALYILTIASLFSFGLWEWKLKRQLTDEFLEQQHESVSDIDSFYEIRRNFKREHILKSLPREALFKLRVVVSLKFLFFVILIIEVAFLQR